MKKILALLCALVLLVAPAASAQTTDVPVEPVAAEVTQVTEEVTQVTEVAPATPLETVVEESTPTEPDAVVSQPDSVVEVVQETASSTQVTASAELLEEAANPEIDLPSEATTIPVEAATTTEESIPDVIVIEEEPAGLAPDEIPVAAQSDLTIVATGIQTAKEDVRTNAQLNAEIEPAFVMSLSGNTLPTKRKLGDSTESVTTTIDPAKKVVNVSGTCSDAYYVVLLYKNQTDYDTDPASYILNRAYTCESGSYDYAIDDLPASVQNGTYYLLIGEQGERGSWRPVTSLTEVSINRSN